MRTLGLVVVGLSLLSVVEAREASFQAYLWANDVACMGDGGDRSELRIQARYYSHDRKQIYVMPQFVKYAPNPSFPYGHAIRRSTCEILKNKIDRINGQLIPITGVRGTGKTGQTVEYPCGPAHPKTGDRGTCRGRTSVDTVNVRFHLNGHLFSGSSYY